jgi:hypothetical protein
VRRAEKPWSTDWENHPFDLGYLIRDGFDKTKKTACNVTLRNSERRVVNEACEQERNWGAEGHSALEVRMRQNGQQYNRFVIQQCVGEIDVDRLWGDELMPWIHSGVTTNRMA